MIDSKRMVAIFLALVLFPTLTRASPPTAPADLIAWPSGLGRLDLEWGSSARADRYTVGRCSPIGSATCATCSIWANVATLSSSATSYTDDASVLEPKTEYCYRVSASNSSGSTYSDRVSVVSAYTYELPLHSWTVLEPYNQYDDTALLQGALDALVADPDGPQVIFLEEGTYLISDTLVLPPSLDDHRAGVQIVGSTEGSGVTIKWHGCHSIGPLDVCSDAVIEPFCADATTFPVLPECDPTYGCPTFAPHYKSHCRDDPSRWCTQDSDCFGGTKNGTTGLWENTF